MPKISKCSLSKSADLSEIFLCGASLANLAALCQCHSGSRSNYYQLCGVGTTTTYPHSTLKTPDSEYECFGG